MFCAAAFVTPAASAQDENSKSASTAASTPEASGGAHTGLSAAEIRFVKEAGGGNLAEAKLGELAQSKSTNAEVKTFGQTMIADHTRANTDLGAVAGKKGMPFEPKINTRNEASYERLSKLSGSAFDKAYVDAMISDHEADATEYQQAIKDGSDADLKKYATDTLQVVEHHLQMAKDIKEKFGAGAAK